MSTEIKKGSKEFYELLDCFEKAFRSLPVRVMGSEPLKRSPRDSYYFYENGDTNNLFLLFLAGHSAGLNAQRGG